MKKTPNSATGKTEYTLNFSAAPSKKQSNTAKRGPRVRHPIQEVGDNELLILETKIRKNTVHEGNEGIPPIEMFKGFCIDERTAKAIEKSAMAVEMGEPCLLEGITATSKTSSIMLLASLLHQPIVRMNLNGQTDTSELIGKFVPNDGQLAIEWDEMLRSKELLTTETRSILKNANERGRGLTKVEVEKIAQYEHFNVPDWRWQHGVVPRAMIDGIWVVLDEINLAEPQILERINSVLERPSSIVLTENSGLVIGHGGDHAVHPNFRMFATMNPADYSGRSIMSPAYKNRWTSAMFVQPPSALEYTQMLCLHVYGTQPDLTINGKKYKGKLQEPLFPELQQLPNMEGFLVLLGKTHEAVEKMAASRVIGTRRKEPYIFTRRELIGILEFLSSKKLYENEEKAVSVIDDPVRLCKKAIEYYYFDKLGADDADKRKVQDFFDANGIGPTSFTYKFQVETKTEKTKEKEVSATKGEMTGEAFTSKVEEWSSSPDYAGSTPSNWVWAKSEDGKYISVGVSNSTESGGETNFTPDVIDNDIREPADLVPQSKIDELGGEEFVPIYLMNYEDSIIVGLDALKEYLKGKRVKPFGFKDNNGKRVSLWIEVL